MAQNSFPIQPQPDNDPRFTYGMLFEVSQVLRNHGYEPFEQGDYVNLQQALFRFLYGSVSDE